MFRLPVVVKIFLAFLAVYLGIAYSLFVFSKPTYNYRSYDLLQEQSTILLRPIMEVLADGKVSHWYDWREVSKNETVSNDKGVNYNTEIPPLTINSNNKLYRDLGHNLAPENVWASLGAIKPAGIVEPVSYQQEWSLIFCDTKYNICQESNILNKGKVKILVDGNQNLWGKTKSGNIIQLKLIEYTDRSNSKDVLFI